MKKLIILAAIIPGFIFAQSDISKSLDSQFRLDIYKARSENGFSVSPDEKLDALAKKRVLALKKIFQDNWNRGVSSSEFGHIFIGDKHFRQSFSHGIKKENLPSGFVYNKKDSAVLPFSIFEKSIRDISYSAIEENHTYPISLNQSELIQIRKNLVIPREYFSIISHYKQSKNHFESVTGVSMKDKKNRKFGSYAEIFEVEKGKYILFQVAIFTSN